MVCAAVIVSHSNMKTFANCQMKFYFSVKLNLRPKEWPEPIARGFFGHDLMKVAFTAILNGADYDEAVAAANAELEKKLQENPQAVVLSNIYRNVLAFVGYYFTQPWETVHVEQNENWAINDDVTFGFTPDLVLRWTKGPKAGLPFVLDFKFTGQFWNDRQLNTVQQMPKYVIYLNKKYGFKIRHAGVVMLNTRAAQTDNKNLFLVKWLPISKEKLKTIEHENEVWAKQIEPYMRMTPDEFHLLAVRTPDDFACKTCWFADDLCPMDMNGQDITATAKANYEVNDYGYN